VVSYNTRLRRRSCHRVSADIAGLKLEGADWTASGIQPNEGESHARQSAYIVWHKAGGTVNSSTTVNLPVYLNQDRASVLFSVNLEASGCDKAEVAQKGVCLSAL
jgi:dynein heavy chain 1